jgi:hypothetical protein
MWVVVRTWGAEKEPDVSLFTARESAMQCWREKLDHIGGAKYWEAGGIDRTTGYAWTNDGNYGAEMLCVIEAVVPVARNTA